MDNFYLLGIFAAMSLATMLTRSLPFVALGKVQRNRVLDRCGQLLPPMIMVVLVCFGLLSLEIKSFDRGGLSILSLAVVIGLQSYVKNPLLSILAGTGLYVIGIQGFGL